MPKKKAPESPEDVRNLINKKYGDGTMVTAADPRLRIERIPSGVLTVDAAMGGGYPRGRHVELYGGYSVGKTYLTYRLIGNAQKLGHNCAFLDVENSFDPEFAAHAGVMLDDLSYKRQETHGNEVIDTIEVLLRSRQFDVIVMDSIAALLPKQEADSEISKSTMGTQQAKLMSAAMRKLTAANSQTVLVYINQTRDAVGSMFKKDVTSGGRAMSFYAGTRLELIRTENIKKTVTQIDPATHEEKSKKITIGHRVLVRIEKDKTGGARQETTTSFVFNYNLGSIDHIEELVYLGRVYEFIKKSGNYYWVEGYDDQKQNGKAKFRKWLRRNTAVAEDLEEWIREEALEPELQEYDDAEPDE